jgi:hypothetical protein
MVELSDEIIRWVLRQLSMVEGMEHRLHSQGLSILKGTVKQARSVMFGSFAAQTQLFLFSPSAQESLADSLSLRYHQIKEYFIESSKG